MEIKFSIQLTSVFNDEQTAVRRKEYLGQPTIRLRRYGWETSTEGSLRRKKEEKANLARLSQAMSKFSDHIHNMGTQSKNFTKHLNPSKAELKIVQMKQLVMQLCSQLNVSEKSSQPRSTPCSDKHGNEVDNPYSQPTSE